MIIRDEFWNAPTGLEICLRFLSGSPLLCFHVVKQVLILRAL